MKSLLILATLIAAPFAAHAETAPSQQVLVSTAGLDLRNPADAAAMIGRIEVAVRPICVRPNAANGRTTAGCIRKLTAATVSSLRIPSLDLAFQTRSGPVRPVALG